MRSIASGARATICTNGCARCFSCTRSIASTCRSSAASAGRLRFRFSGYENLLKRRFEEAIEIFLAAQREQGPERGDFERAGSGYHGLGFQTLAEQVRRSVRTVRGNQWMFRVGHPADYPLRMRPELLARPAADALLSDPARDDAGAHGPDAQRLERHFFSGHGLSRKARAC